MFIILGGVFILVLIAGTGWPGRAKKDDDDESRFDRGRGKKRKPRGSVKNDWQRGVTTEGEDAVNSDAKPNKAHVYRKHASGFISSRQFASAIIQSVPAAKPRHPLAFEGEWYCTNDGCEVRQVKASFQFVDGPAQSMPPALSCPLCGKALAFRHYLASEMYVRDE
jgi:hypothetical protein